MSKAGLNEISQSRTVESLQRALDQVYRHFLETAKADWQQLFGGGDPSDSCVSVRISTDEMANELAGIPRAGVVPIKRRKPVNGKFNRRLA